MTDVKVSTFYGISAWIGSFLNLFLESTNPTSFMEAPSKGNAG